MTGSDADCTASRRPSSENSFSVTATRSHQLAIQGCEPSTGPREQRLRRRQRQSEDVGRFLDGSVVEFDNIDLLHTTAGAPTTTTFTANTDLTTNYTAGDFIFLQAGESDRVHIAKLATVNFSSSTTTFTVATGFEIPAALAYAVGTKFGKVRKVSVGGVQFQPEMSAKIVGLMPKNGQPMTILLPKVKITRGLAASFSTDNFANMPFELTPYAGIPGDPFYAEYGAAKMHLFPR